MLFADDVMLPLPEFGNVLKRISAYLLAFTILDIGNVIIFLDSPRLGRILL